MGIRLIGSTIAAIMFATAVAGGAAAQTAEFKCPAPGAQFTYKSGSLDRVSTATGKVGNVCLFNSTSDGKAGILRVHWGLVGSVDAQGESFANGLNLGSLWPLKVGNTITNTVTVVGRDGKPYTSVVTVAVTAYEKVTVPAGTFDAFRVEESKANESARHIHWWAPAAAVSVKDSFPDWRNPGKVIVLELTSLKAAGN
jgi:hypothetical protein